MNPERLREEVLGRLDAGQPAQAWEVAARAFSAERGRTRHYALSLLGALAPHLPGAAWTVERRMLAGRLRVLVLDPITRTGVVAFPTVGKDGGAFVAAHVQRVGGVHDHLPQALAEDSREAVGLALDAARRVLNNNAVFRVEFDRFGDWGGESCGLAVALAAVSAARGIEVPDHLVATGRVVAANGAIGTVDSLSEKISLLQVERPKARLLVPGDGARLHPSAVAVRDLCSAVELLTPRSLTDLDEPFDEIRRFDRNGDWLQAARLAAGVVDVPELETHERLNCLAVLLMAANHSADAVAYERWSVRLDQLAELKTGRDLARAIGGRAVGAIDRLQPDAARSALELADGRSWDPEDRVHLLGPQALLAILEGRFEEAVELRRESLGIAARFERPRCLGDLGDALLRLGDVEAALKHIQEGLSLVASARRRRGYIFLTERFLQLHHARALAALEQPEPARLELERLKCVSSADLRLRARLALAELNGDPALVAAAESDLPRWMRDALVVRALIDRTLGRLGDDAARKKLVSAGRVFDGVAFEAAARRLPY